MTISQLKKLLNEHPDDAEVLFMDTNTVDEYQNTIPQEIHGVSREQRYILNGAVYLWNV